MVALQLNNYYHLYYKAIKCLFLLHYLVNVIKQHIEIQQTSSFYV